MSGDDREPTGRARTGGASLLLAVTLLVGLLALGGLVAAGPAVAEDDGDESAAPELDSGEKINATAVELLFVDDDGVDPASIGPEDFLLSDGELADVSATAEGTDATATLVLAEPIQSDELSIGIAVDSDIQDVNGTTIRTADSPSVTISDMDGAHPSVLGANVGDALGGPAVIEFRFDEPVTEMHVEITGPENVTLDIGAFENTRANRYVTEYEPPESGEYSVALVNATDEAGNTGPYSLVRTFSADRSDPEAVIGIDFSASAGTNVTFDGSQSLGDRLNHTWEFGDGATATGERVSHAFTPEEHTITLTVEDEFGNTDQDRIDLNLTDGLESEDVEPADGAASAVIVDRDDPETPLNSLVSVTGALADDPVAVGSADDSERPLLDRGSVALDSIVLTPTVNSSFSFALSALAPGDVGDVTDEETVPLGGFTVLSDAVGGELASTEFTFGVDADHLDTHDVSSDDVELWRDAGDGWERLDTTVAEASGDRYRFNASTPGFSRFAVVGITTDDDTDHNGENDGNGQNDGGADTGEPALAVTDAAVDATEIEAGESVGVTATVENEGEGDGSFRAGLELDGAVADTRDVAVEAGERETVAFAPTFDEPGTVEVAVNGTSAGEVTVTEQEDELDIDEESFSVINVRLNETSIEPGETVEIDADVLNEGDEMADYVAELEVDGEVVDTFEAPQVPPDEDIPIFFTEQFDEEGTYNISVSGSDAPEPLEVGQGGLLGFLDFLPLGFVPFGLIQTVLTFVGIPLLFVYLVLKSMAFYLGY